MSMVAIIPVASITAANDLLNNTAGTPASQATGRTAFPFRPTPD